MRSIQEKIVRVATKTSQAVVASLALGIVCMSSCRADGFTPFSYSDVQFLWGRDYKFIPGNEQFTFTFEDYRTWKYGDSYFFVDFYDQQGDNQTAYGEWSPSISLTRIFGLKPSEYVTDVHLAESLNYGQNFQAYQTGIGFDFKIPAFDFFRVDAYYYRNGTTGQNTFQITPSWDTTWKFTPRTHVRFRGYCDFVGEGSSGAAYALCDPQLELDMGNLLGAAPGHLYTGVEYRYWRNKFGVSGVTENVPQLLTTWFF